MSWVSGRCITVLEALSTNPPQANPLRQTLFLFVHRWRELWGLPSQVAPGYIRAVINRHFQIPEPWPQPTLFGGYCVLTCRLVCMAVYLRLCVLGQVTYWFGTMVCLPTVSPAHTRVTLSLTFITSKLWDRECISFRCLNACSSRDKGPVLLYLCALH